MYNTLQSTASISYQSELLQPSDLCFFFFNDTATTEIYTLSLHDALPICAPTTGRQRPAARSTGRPRPGLHGCGRSEEHTSELQSRLHLVCRLLLEKKKNSRSTTLEPSILHGRYLPMLLGAVRSVPCLRIS